VCLPGEFVGGEVIAFAVGCGCRLVGVGGFVVVFGSAIVRALRHVCCPLVVGCNFLEEMCCLSAHPSAVDGKNGAGDVVAGWGAEKESCTSKVLRLAPAGCGDAFEDLAISGLIGLECLSVGGGEVAGGDGVDLNSFGSPLIGECFGELGYATFAGGVGGDADATLKAEKGGYVDDFSHILAGGGACDHVAGCELSELEDAGEVNLENLLPVCEGYIFCGGAEDGAGVVDEDIDAAKFFFDLGEEVFGTGGGGEIGAEGCGALADGFGGFSSGATVAVAGHFGSGLR
jgi:hypothetical protein